MKRLKEYETPLLYINRIAMEDVLMLSGQDNLSTNFDYDNSEWL